MNFKKIQCFAKINLSLNVIKKLPNKYHKIESLITFIKLSDFVKIKEINNSKHKISFSGKYSLGIKKKNSITKLFDLLDKKKLLKNRKFEINVKKNIPQMSGMGGGSMNASFILNYLIKKKFFNISHKNLIKIANEVGSDVALGLEKKNSILQESGKIIRLKNKLNLHVLVVMPNFGCSTKSIFSKVNQFSKPLYLKGNKSFFTPKNLAQSKNDLENVVFKKYSKMKDLKNFVSRLPNIVFARMTGSGSAIVAYFKSKKSANSAAKIFKRKYKSYWYAKSKTI